MTEVIYKQINDTFFPDYAYLKLHVTDYGFVFFNHRLRVMHSFLKLKVMYFSAMLSTFIPTYKTKERFFKLNFILRCKHYLLKAPELMLSLIYTYINSDI